ncbi:hypothetical protein [Phocoenobacter uteri]|uniref:hypothetical protein n=1 Tax=Phocoenobacter uteri TaxID=146806 RepID=UPI002441D5A5|nr:hypothetical protein [Phocoenobacter uteri]
MNELIEYADYSIDSDYLFEVMTNVERLAQNIRQLHIYPSGRKSYDPVIKALRMLGGWINHNFKRNGSSNKAT